MENQKNIIIIKKLFEEVYTKGDLIKCPDYIAENVIINDVAKKNGLKGLKGFKDMEEKYKTAFPTKKVTIQDIFGVEDKVVVRWNCQGMHQGKLDDISASNEKINITGISIYRFANGKIVEIWQSWDRLGLFEQIGEVQPALALHA